MLLQHFGAYEEMPENGKTSCSSRCYTCMGKLLFEVAAAPQLMNVLIDIFFCWDDSPRHFCR